MDTAPALDPGVFAPSPLGLVTPAVSAPLRFFPPDEPGDPLIPPPDAVPRRRGRRLALIAATAITHDPITHAGSGVVDSFDDPIGLEPSTISFGIAEDDPVWGLLHAPKHRMRGRDRWMFPDDDGQLEWQVWDERRLLASGVTGSPVSRDGGRLRFTARGPESVLQSRSVGAGGTNDLLGGSGSFPTASLTGWAVAGLTTGWSTDSFDGDRALTVNGYGTVASPWVGVTGAASRWQDVRSAVMVKLPASEAAVFVETQVRLPSGAIVRADVSAAGKGSSTALSGPREWQQVVGKAGIPPTVPGGYQVRTVVTGLSQDPTLIDRDVITQNYQTGSIDPLELADFPLRIMTAAQEPESGGWLGIGVRKRGDTGVLRQFSWSHSATPKTLDMLQAVAQTPGGPDMWCDPGWVLNVAPRQGRDRRDYALTDDVIISAAPAWDPAGRNRDLLVLTGWGAGPTRSVIGYQGPASPGRRRRRREVSAPSELTFREAERWGQAEHAHEDQRRREIDVTVPWEMGAALATGDGLLTASAWGALCDLGAVRIANRTFYDAAETCVLTVADDAVVGL